MKWYTRLLVFLVIAGIIAGSGFATEYILKSEFRPADVCAGEEGFAVSEQFDGNWYVTVFDKEGKRDETYLMSLPAPIWDSELSYADGIYYFWLLDKEKTGISVDVRAIYPSGDITHTILGIDGTEQIVGMTVHEETMSVVSVRTAEEGTVVNVYTAGKDAPGFLPIYTGTLPRHFVRKAYYRSDGTVVYLTAGDSIYSFSTLDQKPRPKRLCKGASELYLNAEEEICFRDSDGNLRLADDPESEYLPEMGEFLTGMTSEDVSILSDSFSAVSYSSEENWYTAYMQNGRAVVVDRGYRTAWWVYALVYALVLLLTVALVSFAINGVVSFFQSGVSILYRTRVILFFSGAAVIIAVTGCVVSRYKEQQAMQDWESISLIYNTASNFIDPWNLENVESFAQMDRDTQGGKLYSDPNFKALNDFSELCVRRGVIVSLLTFDKDGELTAITGTSDMLGMRLSAIYDSATVEEIYKNLKDNYGTDGEFREKGVDWHYGAFPVISVTDGTVSSVMLVQIPEQRGVFSNVSFIQTPEITASQGFSDGLVFASLGVVYTAVIAFGILLFSRLRKSLKPLRDMEQQAQQFTLTETYSDIKFKGNNEISLLVRRFQEAVSELAQGLKKSRRSVESYGRFLDKKWVGFFRRENLFQLNAGASVTMALTVLEIRFSLKGEPEKSMTPEQKQRLLENVLPVVRRNGGVVERISPENMKIVFAGDSEYALYSASMIRERCSGEYTMCAVIDGGTAQVSVMGDEENSRFVTEFEDEDRRLSLMRRICSEFGCEIAVTGEITELIPQFQSIFNSRIIGFFGMDGGKMRVVEILPQRCSEAFERGVSLYYSGECAEAFEQFCRVLEKNPDDMAAVRYLRLCNDVLHGDERRGEVW